MEGVLGIVVRLLVDISGDCVKMFWCWDCGCCCCCCSFWVKSRSPEFLDSNIGLGKNLDDLEDRADLESLKTLALLPAEPGADTELWLDAGLEAELTVSADSSSRDAE